MMRILNYNQIWILTIMVVNNVGMVLPKKETVGKKNTRNNLNLGLPNWNYDLLPWLLSIWLQGHKIQ